ncbi:MAG: DUF6268 family outer membrane beta-barrel protein [Marinifilaceae bacterium]|nr:DUF6268 family outer membrane beta-barrel protein [Marinifilaceae bacterium]
MFNLNLFRAGQKIYNFVFCFVFISLFNSNSCMAQSDDYWQPSVGGEYPVRGIEYRFTKNMNYNLYSKSEVYGNANGRIEDNCTSLVKLKFPIINKAKFKSVIGFDYGVERIKFSSNDVNNYEFYKGVDNKKYPMIGTGIYALAKLRHDMFFMFRSKFKLKGDYNSSKTKNISRKEFLQMELSPIIGWKKTENKSYGFGFAYSYSFGDPLIFPLFLYNRYYPSRKLNLHAYLPAKINISKQVHDKFFIGYRLNAKGGSYSVYFEEDKLKEYSVLALKRSEINSSIELLYGLSPWLWASCNIGYRHNINFHLTNNKNKVSFHTARENEKIVKSDADSGLFIELSIFISPSDEIKKLFTRD